MQKRSNYRHDDKEAKEQKQIYKQKSNKGVTNQ